MSKKDDFTIIKIDGQDTIYQISKSNGWLIRNKNTPDKLLTVNKKKGRVVLNINKKRKSCYIKKIFAETFIPNPQHFKFVIFKNYNKKNIITIDNLEWGTRSMAVKRSYTTNRTIQKKRKIYLSV